MIKKFGKENLGFLKPLIGLLLLVLIVGLNNPRFFYLTNVLNILRQSSVNAIIAFGMTFVIISGGIDLSVGSILAFAGALTARLISINTPTAAAVLAALAVGSAIGLFSGTVISRFRVQPFIATLAVMTIFRGAVLVFTGSKPISISGAASEESFSFLGSGYLWEIPVPVVLMFLVLVLLFYVLHRTRFGKYCFAVGSNEDVSYLAGLKVKSLKVGFYVISGFLAALAGIIQTARLSSAQPTAGLGYELDAIAAVVLGGTSLAGGRGSIIRTLLGVLIIGTLNNALNLLDVSPHSQMLIKGAVILFAVLLDRKER